LATAMSKVKRQRLLKPRILQLRIAMTYEAMKEYICLTVSQSMLANIYLASLVIDKTYFYFLLSLCSAYYMLQKKNLNPKMTKLLTADV